MFCKIRMWAILVAWLSQINKQNLSYPLSLIIFQVFSAYFTPCFYKCWNAICWKKSYSAIFDVIFLKYVKKSKNLKKKIPSFILWTICCLLTAPKNLFIWKVAFSIKQILRHDYLKVMFLGSGMHLKNYLK